MTDYLDRLEALHEGLEFARRWLSESWVRDYQARIEQLEDEIRDGVAEEMM